MLESHLFSTSSVLLYYIYYGKSHLINLCLYLGRRNAAIVSPFAGTTRDILEINLDIGGYPVLLCDTAGLRISNDPVEKEGIRRAKEVASSADLAIIVVDAALDLNRFKYASLDRIVDDFNIGLCLIFIHRVKNLVMYYNKR